MEITTYLLLKVKSCRQILVHYLWRRCWELGFLTLHMCCRLLFDRLAAFLLCDHGGRRVAEQGSFYYLRSLIAHCTSLRLSGACWENRSSCTAASLLQCLRIISACQLVEGCHSEGSPDSAVPRPVCWHARGVGLYLAYKLNVGSYLNFTTVIW